MILNLIAVSVLTVCLMINVISLYRLIDSDVTETQWRRGFIWTLVAILFCTIMIPVNLHFYLVALLA